MLEGSSVSRGVKNGNVCSRNESIQLKYMELMHHFAGGNSSNWNSMAKEAVHSLFLKGYQRSRAPGKTKNTKEKTQKKPSNTSNAAVKTEGDKCDHNANNIVDTNKSTGDEEFHTAREDSSGIPISGVQTVGDRSPKFLFNDLPSPEGNLLHYARLGDRPIKVKIQMKPGMGSLAPTHKIANQINSRQGGTQEGGATLGIPKMVERNRTGVHKTTKPYPECQRFHDEKVMDWLSVKEKHIREANRRKRVEERAKRQADYAAEIERKRRAELATVAFEEWLNRKTKPTEAKKRHRVAAVLRVSRKAQKAQKDSPPSGPLELHVPAWKSNGDMEQSDQEKEGTSISLVPLKAHPEHPHTQVAQAKTTLVECPPVRQIKPVTGRPRETTVEHATTLKMTTLQPQEPISRANASPVINVLGQSNLFSDQLLAKRLTHKQWVEQKYIEYCRDENARWKAKGRILLADQLDPNFLQTWKDFLRARVLEMDRSGSRRSLSLSKPRAETGQPKETSVSPAGTKRRSIPAHRYMSSSGRGKLQFTSSHRKVIPRGEKPDIIMRSVNDISSTTARMDTQNQKVHVERTLANAVIEKMPEWAETKIAPMDGKIIC